MIKITALVSILFLSLNLIACGAGSSAGDISGIQLTVDDSPIDNSNPIPAPVVNGETGVVSLSWIPPTENTDGSYFSDLAGYKIYYGTNSNNLSYLLDVDMSLTSYVIENDQRILVGNRYYFGITAFNSTQVESPMSNIVFRDL